MNNSLGHPNFCSCPDCDPPLEGRPIAWAFIMALVVALVLAILILPRLT